MRNPVFGVSDQVRLKQTVPVSASLRLFIFNALIAGHLTAVGSSLARVTSETRQVLLVGDQVVSLGISSYRPTFQ